MKIACILIGTPEIIEKQKIEILNFIDGNALKISDYIILNNDNYQDIEKNKYDLFLFASNIFSSSAAIKFSYRLNGSACTGVKNIIQEENKIFVIKPIYSNNLIGKFHMKKAPYCISIENRGSGDSSNIIAVGQGISEKENLGEINKLATYIHAKVCGSRPVIMNAWLEMEKLIGVSGVIVSPAICFVLGASGMGAFKVGIEKSKKIIAINIDAKSPIFKIADIGIVNDFKLVTDDLLKLIEKK
ncbi:MAG: FAD-binding protein [Fusobacteriaceae bacterium]